MKALPRWAAWSVAALLPLAWSGGCSSSDKPDRDADAPLTASGSCRTRPERCNAKDDDCDGIVDERADSSCGLAHAVGSCVRGQCSLARCSEGYTNCNGIMSDGCETMNECVAAPTQSGDAAAPAESMTSAPERAPERAPELRDAAAASAPVKSAEAPQAGPQSVPEPDDADGGEDTDASGPVGDAGANCVAELCDGQDNDCDANVDESAACGCKDAAPTGQGPECDQCVCDACPEALAACTGTDDDKWNTLCGAVVACFGKSVQAGLCTGDDSDCFQNGDGPCASEFRAAFELGWICTADPVRTPCGALTRVRLECFRNQCAAVCKA